MRQLSGIPRIKGLIVAFLLLAISANDARAQEIELWGYGPALADEKVQEALMRAVDWSSLTSSIFNDPYIAVVLYPQEGEPLDNLSLEFDPELAAELLAGEEEAGGEGLQFTLLYVSDFNLALLAGALAENLGQLKIEVTPLEAGSEDELYEAEVYLASEPDVNALILEFAK